MTEEGSVLHIPISFLIYYLLIYFLYIYANEKHANDTLKNSNAIQAHDISI